MKTSQIVSLSIIALVALAFTVGGFFVPQECGIDREFLWCRLHPFTVADLVGTVGFYGSLLLLAGVLHILGEDKIYLQEKPMKLVAILALVLVASVVLIWNL